MIDKVINIIEDLNNQFRNNKKRSGSFYVSVMGVHTKDVIPNKKGDSVGFRLKTKEELTKAQLTEEKSMLNWNADNDLRKARNSQMNVLQNMVRRTKRLS